MIRSDAGQPERPPHLVQELEDTLDAETIQLSRREVPQELLETATISGLVRMTLEEWGMIAGLWTAMAFSPWWIRVLLLVPIAGRFHALGVVLHDATHLAMKHKTAGSRFVEILCGYPIASTLNAMRYHHLRHHRDSGMDTDPYYKAGRQTRWWWTVNTLRGLALVPFWSVRGLLGATAFLVPALRNLYAHVFLQDRAKADLRGSREVIDCARAEFGQVVFQTAIVAGAMVYPRQVLLGYIVPVSLAGLFAARRVLIEHNYARVSDRSVETTIAATNDNYLGLMGAVSLAPRNIGYHIVHHIHPQVRLEALPRLRDWYERRYPALYPPQRR